ncbi:hypothetical protein BKA61DRAFT_654708 [Leptodontidium sp. MPI-SDFR-AT-0119]|nr:hypothetical protein BKA61DRAFT_654708 [Leptodontidium sp. MPI-SDFR-AT-0119]
MHYQTLLLLASLASNALATPSLTSRQSSTCDQQRLACGAAPGANQSLCAVQKEACDACEAAYEAYITSPNSNKSLAASLRNECFAASAVGDGNGVLPIISSLTVAGTTPTSTTSAVASATSSAPATTTAASTCDQQRLDCGSAPGANQSLCAVQKEACDACEAAYESYVTSPGSNKSFAASLRNECFAASKEGSGDGVVPIISSFSAAQTGTPTVAPYPTASASTTAIETYPVPTTTSILAHPGNATYTATTLSTGTTIPAPSTTPFNGAADSLKPIGVMGLLLLGAALIV